MTAVGVDAAAIVAVPEVAAVVSVLVRRVTVVLPVVVVLVTPAIVRVVAVEAATVQAPPLSASVTVTTLFVLVPEGEPAPVATQFAPNPPMSAIAGLVGIEKPGWKVIVIVEPARSCSARGGREADCPGGAGTRPRVTSWRS